MSEAEIQYRIPADARKLGDLETILNAMGAFEDTFPFPYDRQYDARPSEEKDDEALIRLVRTTPYAVCDYHLLESAEEMREGVETHFPKADRERLMGHYVGVVTRFGIKTEQSEIKSL